MSRPTRSTADATFTSPAQPAPLRRRPTWQSWRWRETAGDAPAHEAAAGSKVEPAGIDRLHAAHLDDAIRGQVSVRVQLDEGIGAVGEPVDLARRRERRGVSESEVLVAGYGVVGVHAGEVEHVAFRAIEVDDDVRVIQAALGDRRPQEYVAAAVASQCVEPEAAGYDVDPVVAGEEVVELVTDQI